MWELVLALLALLLTFSALLYVLVSKLLQVVSESSAASTRLQSEALATVLAPVLAPKPEPLQIQDIPEETPPRWRQEADSPDLVDALGRPLDWGAIPVIPEEQTVGPADLWAKPSAT